MFSVQRSHETFEHVHWVYIRLYLWEGSSYKIEVVLEKGHTNIAFVICKKSNLRGSRNKISSLFQKDGYIHENDIGSLMVHILLLKPFGIAGSSWSRNIK